MVEATDPSLPTLPDLQARESERAIKYRDFTNYDQLVKLKNKYDPTNFFRVNHNIKPSQTAPTAMTA